MAYQFCLSVAMLTWATGLVFPGGGVSLNPNPKKSIDTQHRPTVLVQDSGEEIETQNGIGQWRPGNFTNRLGNYEIHGDRQGQVTVRDLVSGEIVRTFQMPEERVIRTTWLLEGGEVAAASQVDLTLFWDMETGEEIGRIDYQVYAFSHHLEKLIAFGYPEGFFIYDYPDLRQICSIPYARAAEPIWMQFSPNYRHLLVGFWTNMPDIEHYSISNTRPYSRTFEMLFELDFCQQVQEFYDLNIWSSSEMCFNSNSPTCILRKLC